MTEETEEKKEFPGRMTDDELRQFVVDFMGGNIFTHLHIPETEEWLIQSVFMPLALGGLKDVTKEELENVGLIWEDLRKAGPRSINGMPGFFSCHFMHKDDWERARAAIKRETERAKEMEI